MTIAEAASKLEEMLQRIDAGQTMYICTALRVTRVTKRNVAAWAKSGRPLLKTDGKSIYIAAGKLYDCIDYCGIRFTA